MFKIESKRRVFLETIFHERMQCLNCLYIRNFINESIDKITNNYFLEDDEVFEIKLILNELVSNAFIHGNKGSAKKYIELDIKEVDPFSLKISVNDQGEGWNYHTVLNKFDSSKPNIALDEHGRGLIIVSNLCESLVFNEKGNGIEIVKKVGNKNGIKKGIGWNKDEASNR